MPRLASRGHTLSNGLWLRETSASARAARLALLSWAYSVSVLFALLFKQRGTICHVRFYLFSSIVCGVLRASVRGEHNGAISTIPAASLREHDGSISPTPHVYIENMARDCREKVTRVLSYFSANRNVFTVRRTNT